MSNTTVSKPPAKSRVVAATAATTAVAASLPSTKIVEDYVKLNAAADAEDDTGEEKSAVASVVARTLGGVKSLLARGMAMASKGKGVLPITLTLAFNGTSGAAVSQAPVVSIQPGSSTEFASLNSLYDEFICDSVTVHWRLYAASNAQTSGFLAAVAYDPTNSGGYTSVPGVCEARQHFGPVGAPVASGTGLQAAPAAHTKTGMWTFRAKMPKGPHIHDPNVNSVVGTGQWTTTAVSTTTYGYLKFFVEAASTGTTAINGVMLMHCRFRSRT